MYLQSLVFTLEIILPVFLIVVVGVFLKKRNMIDDHFVAVGSRLVFNLALPLLVFLAIADVRFGSGSHLALMLFVLIAIVVSLALSAAWCRAVGVNHSDRSAFIQAAFRSNLGIVGIATAVYAFGEQGAKIGALVLAVGVPTYNLLSVLVLASGKGINWGGQLLLIARNPLIIAIVCALPFSLLGIEIPAFAGNALHSIGQMTLPLALICVGGSLDFTALRQANGLAMQIAALKLLVLPLLTAVAAYLVGFRGTELGVITLMLASPTAAAAFVMARAMGANHSLTANAIAVTTLGSMLSMGGIFYVLRILSLV